jgi:DNA-binding NarL/FixJ family response regulator
VKQLLRTVIVDDSSAYRMLIGLAVEQDARGEVVGEARNGFEGYRIVQRTAPDVVVVDLRMPELGGIELIGLLRQHGGSRPRIIAYSGNIDLLDGALKAGADAAVLKSSDTSALVSAIADPLGKHTVACA